MTTAKEQLLQSLQFAAHERAKAYDLACKAFDAVVEILSEDYKMPKDLAERVANSWFDADEKPFAAAYLNGTLKQGIALGLQSIL